MKDIEQRARYIADNLEGVYSFDGIVQSAQKKIAVAAALEALKPQWISVEDRLPKANQRVILYSAWDNYQFVGYWDGNEYLMDAEYLNYDQCRNDVFLVITHWQPLPSPPESE